MINKLPVYQQLNIALRNLLNDDHYAPGDKFLTERTICEQYGVSRSTANKALSSLVSEKLLEFKKGVGTFVAGKQREKIYSAEMPEEDLTVEVLSCLPVFRDENFFELTTLSFSNSLPMILEVTLIPEQFYRDLPSPLQKELPADLPGKIGKMQRLFPREEIEAAILSPGEASRLELKNETAVLSLITIYSDRDGVPVMKSRALMRPGYFRLRSVSDRPFPQRTES